MKCNYGRAPLGNRPLGIPSFHYIQQPTAGNSQEPAICEKALLRPKPAATKQKAGPSINLQTGEKWMGSGNYSWVADVDDMFTNGHM